MTLPRQKKCSCKKCLLAALVYPAAIDTAQLKNPPEKQREGKNRTLYFSARLIKNA
jgi:hypothetical protein